MAAYDYVAVDAAGRRKRGVISADTERLARRELRQRSLTPVKIAPAAAKSSERASLQFLQGKGASQKDVVLATRQLATLISAAAPVEEALRAVAMQTEKRGMRSALLSMRARVMEGYRFSEALAEQDRLFDSLYRSMVAAGESSGDLGLVLGRLADYLENTQKMRQKVLTAIIYPSALAAVAIAVVTALMIFVVPKVVEQFESFGENLPLITQILIAVSDGVRVWGGPFALVLAVLIVAATQLLKRPAIREPVDRAILATPVLGKLARGVDAARFARTLATLVASGVTILESLRAAGATVSNLALRGAIESAIEAVQEGEAVNVALRKSGLFPPLLVYMVASGESSGELPLMLGKAADHMDEEFESVTALALKLLEPAIIITMGVLVLGIVLAILSPILQINALAQI